MTDRVQQARDLHAAMVEDRRHLHAHPEVGLDLPATTDHLVGVLTDLGLDPEHHPGAGVSARIAGQAPSGTTRVLRADMDALPVTEATGLPYASRLPGAMHACGHDLHMAMLLGAARGYAEEPPTDDVVLVFQPGEETDRGAVPTLATHTTLPEGDATAFAVHVHATWPAHTVHHRAGTFMAFGDWFEASFSGPGGHASQPHLAGNPVEAGSRFVLGARDLVGSLREDEHLVATVTESLAGNTVNVIPTDGRLRGTLRTLSPERRAALLAGLRAVTEEAGREAHTTARFDLVEGYPAVVNDAAYVDRMVASLTATALADCLTPMTEPSMVIEDFAYFLHRWPGAMVYLGAQVPGHTSFNHAPDAVFDEEVLATGAALHLLAGDGWPVPGSVSPQ
jgi:hippurate hydrolase